MMRFVLAYLFVIESAFAGLPPTTVKGDSESSKTTTFNVQVPFNQATTTAAVTRRIETGSNNVLVNPSFEASTFSTGHSIDAACSAGSVRTDGDVGVSCVGVNTARTLAEQTFALDANTQRAFANNLMTVSVQIAANSANVQICGLQSGSEVNCQSIPISDSLTTSGMPYWATSVTPTTSDTSVGYRIKTTDTTTTAVIFDQVFVGIQNQIVGIVPTPLEYARFYATSNWSSTAVTNVKIPLVNSSDGTRYPLASNCATIVSQGTNPYEIQVGLQAFGNNEDSNVGYTLNGGAVQLSPTFSISTNASGEYEFYMWSWNVNLTLGDVVCAYSRSQTTRTYLNGYMRLQQTRGETYTTAQVVGLVPSETVFSAISSSGGAISGENEDFITTCSISDTSLFTCNWVSGFFGANSPNCVATIGTDASSASMSASVVSASTSQFQVRTLSGGAKSAQPWKIACQRQGADYTRARTTFSNVPYLVSGTYTASLSSSTNLDSTSVNGCIYFQIGRKVSVSCSLQLDATTASNTRTIINVSLPIARTGSSGRCIGNGAAVTSGAIIAQAGGVNGSGAFSACEYSYGAATTAAQTHNLNFSYDLD